MFSSISIPTPSLALLLLATTAQLVTAVSTITLTQSAAPTATSTSFTSDDTFEKDMLDAQNFYRGEHNASALSWNKSSASVAGKWSSACNFVHSGGPTGENLAAGYANASASVDAWGLEREKYSWKSPGFSEATGHFTQLVWRNTTSVGCGRTSCAGKNGTPGWYVVCEYYPPGNVEGSANQFFKDNVKVQSKGKKTDTVESGVSSEGVGGGERRWGFGVLGAVMVVGAVVVW